MDKLSAYTAEVNDDEIALFIWVVDAGPYNGIAWLGSACNSGSTENLSSKTSVTRGPSRGIVETAEVNQLEKGVLIPYENYYASFLVSFLV